jgi:membrane dipeptidase
MKKLLSFFLFIPVILFSQEKIDGKIYEKALKILESSISIDSHSDTPLRLKDTTFDIGKKNRRGCFDFPRMKEGRLSAEFFAIFTSNSEDKNDPLKKALEIIDRVYQTMEKNREVAEMAFSTRDVEKVFKKGKSIICLGMENGGPIENDLNNVKMFYDKGIRYITLTHSSNNHICDSSTDTTELWHGLSPFGKKVVEEMNRLGILIDVSHISDKSFWDAIKLSKVPIVATHSCCRALCNSPRNLTDEMIKALAKNGGVLQLNFYPGYLDSVYDKKSALNYEKMKPALDSLRLVYKERDTNYYREYMKLRKSYKMPEPPDASMIVDHIDHIVKLVGIDYVGIGSDFDGLSIFPKGLEDVSRLPIITYHLLKRGYGEQDIKKIIGGNFLRVWKKVEDFAASQNK